MTVARPVPPPLPPRRSRRGILIGATVVAVVVGYLALSGISNALVYYLTPTELLARGAAEIGKTERLGGLVKIGSISGAATDLTFVLTDETHEIVVHSTVAPTRSFREGAGAVVEGELRADGVFEASQVIVKHDENYVAPTNGALPSHLTQPGS